MLVLALTGLLAALATHVDAGEASAGAEPPWILEERLFGEVVDAFDGFGTPVTPPPGR